ncbi:MAG: hypothetical protein Q7W29_11040 [bacterium]|nr:hypothetical protein [bacterium]
MRTRITAAILAAATALATGGAAAAADPAASGSTITGISSLMNPAISVNALFLGETSADDDGYAANRVGLQEAEMQFTSVVDPFWTADLVVAYHQEIGHDHGDEAADAHDEAAFATDLEVARLRARALPAGFGLVLGKDYLPFGKHVPLHTHQDAFVRAPVAVRSFLGDHGLTEVGARVEATLPLPWYSEAVVYAVNGDAEIFDAHDRDLAWGARWTQTWDVAPTATLELGGSLLNGPGARDADEPAGKLGVYGVDATYKWVSGARSHGPAVTWTGELILPDPERAAGDPRGWYSHLQGRIHRSWWAGFGAGQAADVHGHVDVDGVEVATLTTWNEYRANLTFVPSEYSALRAEVSQLDEAGGDGDDLRFSLQWNFTIGSHPAHLY